MSQAERGLFEQIRGLLPITGCFTNIEKICAEFEQRLAEADAEIEKLKVWRQEWVDRCAETTRMYNELKGEMAEAERERDDVKELISYLIKNSLFDDALSWADGVMGGYGTECANRITPEEGRMANIIMQFDKDMKKRWKGTAPQQER